MAISKETLQLLKELTSFVRRCQQEYEQDNKQNSTSAEYKKTLKVFNTQLEVLNDLTDLTLIGDSVALPEEYEQAIRKLKAVMPDQHSTEFNLLELEVSVSDSLNLQHEDAANECFILASGFEELAEKNCHNLERYTALSNKMMTWCIHTSKQYQKRIRERGNKSISDQENNDLVVLYTKSFAKDRFTVETLNLPDLMAAKKHARAIRNKYHQATALSHVLWMEKKYAEAIELLEKLVHDKKSSEDDLIRLGQCYEGVSNDVKALETFAAAVAINKKNAIYLGYYYQRKGDIKKAADYFVIASADHADAAYWYYLLCKEGLVPHQDKMSAMHYLTSAADRGHPIALFLLGAHLEQQMLVAEAIHYYEIAIRSGETNAMVALALIYEHNPAHRNLKKAAHLFELAANRGNPKAQYRVASLLAQKRMYFMPGLVGDKRDNQAKQYYDWAIRNFQLEIRSRHKKENSGYEYFILGEIHTSAGYRDEVENLKKAREFYRIAKRFNYPGAQSAFYKLEKELHKREKSAIESGLSQLTLNEDEDADTEDKGVVNTTYYSELDVDVDAAIGEAELAGREQNFTLAIDKWKVVINSSNEALLAIKANHEIALLYCSMAAEEPKKKTRYMRLATQYFLTALNIIATEQINTKNMSTDIEQLTAMEDFIKQSIEQYHIPIELDQYMEITRSFSDEFEIFESAPKSDLPVQLPSELPVTISLSDAAQVVCNKLRALEYKVYLVGGATLSGLDPKVPCRDQDLVTDCELSELLKIFPGKIQGKSHPILAFKPHGDAGETIEISHFSNLHQDAMERDFTINTFYYSEGKVLYFGDALKDLKERKIKCIVEARESFTQDPIRILRAVRLSIKTGFKLDDSITSLFTSENFTLWFKKADKNRLFNELMKILSTANNSAIILALYQYKLLKYLLPALHLDLALAKGNLSNTVYEKILKAANEPAERRQNVNACLLMASLLLPNLEKQIAQKKMTSAENDLALNAVINMQNNSLEIPDVITIRVRKILRIYLSLINQYEVTDTTDMTLHDLNLAKKLYVIIHGKKYVPAARGNQNWLVKVLSASEKALIGYVYHENMPKVLEILAQHKNKIIIGDNLKTPLHAAAECNNMQILSAVLAHKQYLNGKDYRGQTALHYAIKNDHPDFIALLIDAGVNPTLADGQKATALHLAAEKRLQNCAKVLIIKCPDLLDIRDKQHRTALDIAIANEDVELATLLLTNNASIEPASSADEKLIDIVKRNPKLYSLIDLVLNRMKALLSPEALIHLSIFRQANASAVQLHVSQQKLTSHK